MLKVSIVIPTFRRPALLERLLNSCMAQVDVAWERCEVIVVDNCPGGSALETVQAFAAASQMPVCYQHEPQPGISRARNAGLERSRGAFIAFIDDDEAASPRWLRHLLDTQAAHDADVVLGPVLPEFPPLADRALDGFLREHFSYAIGYPTGTEIGSGILTPFWARRLLAYPRLASGNALLRREAIGSLRFDPWLGLTGGEDTLFFNQLMADGAKFVWCREAVATEFVPAGRLTVPYLLKRAFRGGQITSRAPLLLRQARPLLTILSMIIGSVQLAAHVPAALLTTALRSPRRFRHACVAAAALGKLLWMRGFQRPVYGPKREDRAPQNYEATAP